MLLVVHCPEQLIYPVGQLCFVLGKLVDLGFHIDLLFGKGHDLLLPIVGVALCLIGLVVKVLKLFQLVGLHVDLLVEHLLLGFQLTEHDLEVILVPLHCIIHQEGHLIDLLIVLSIVSLRSHELFLLLLKLLRSFNCLIHVGFLSHHNTLELVGLALGLGNLGLCLLCPICLLFDLGFELIDMPC